mmetsp:Transcript_6950/g.19761  ORF Transcript_6950/g.19761 Transcript_6950/m.19761 type:complete len:397 (-) Transcript_6950:58-1248(-)
MAAFGLGWRALVVAVVAGARAAVAEPQSEECSDAPVLLQTTRTSPKEDSVLPAEEDPVVAAVTALNPEMWFAMPKEARHKQCIEQQYDLASMPRASVIVPYLHEDLGLMKKFVGSLIGNTPESLLEDILFVDDANEYGQSHAKELRSLHPKVKVHHNAERVGLTHSKVIGTEQTSAPVIVFLEPHCLANRQWLEPLLTQLLASRKSVAVPIVDVLPEETPDKYVYAGSFYGGFDWTLTFKWAGSASERNASYTSPDPFDMPALSGGLLAMWRDWWEESGTYDEQMTEWGGENIEMSLRIWRCGGTIVAVPCSRVGHMFRKSRPYSFHGEAATRNTKRLAAVWLPDKMERVVKSAPALRDMSDVGDVSKRVALREKLGCKNMDWYMQTIYPELDKED